MVMNRVDCTRECSCSVSKYYINIYVGEWGKLKNLSRWVVSGWDLNCVHSEYNPILLPLYQPAHWHFMLYETEVIMGVGCAVKECLVKLKTSIVRDNFDVLCRYMLNSMFILILPKHDVLYKTLHFVSKSKANFSELLENMFCWWKMAEPPLISVLFYVCKLF